MMLHKKHNAVTLFKYLIVILDKLENNLVLNLRHKVFQKERGGQKFLQLLTAKNTF